MTERSTDRSFLRREATEVEIAARPDAVFAFLDDHRQLASHMERGGWRMGGGSMTTTLDEGGGQVVGSHIRMQGRVLGVRLELDEVVSRREPPWRKEWTTVGTPRLLVVGPYTMRADLSETRDGAGTSLRVGIEYALPERQAWLGRLFGRAYARWCVRQMAGDVAAHFGSSAQAPAAISAGRSSA